MAYRRNKPHKVWAVTIAIFFYNAYVLFRLLVCRWRFLFSLFMLLLLLLRPVVVAIVVATPLTLLVLLSTSTSLKGDSLVIAVLGVCMYIPAFVIYLCDPMYSWHGESACACNRY